ncbi:MAG: hypothetical protein IPM81_05445 [Saprospirales bacterium]|nr:hypothetical protein [Saprospirales bacterium]
MKQNIFFSCITLALTLVFLATGATNMQAQNTPAQGADRTKMTEAVPAPLPYCDEVLQQAKQNLQTEANKTCQTTQTCIPCLDRKTGVTVYATLVVQPEDPTCTLVKSMTYETTEGTKAPAIYFEIQQLKCSGPGVTLEVIFPDARAKASDYAYEWMVDGKKAGSSAKIECTAGKAVQVKVMKKGSKISSIKTMSLAKAAPAAERPKE